MKTKNKNIKYKMGIKNLNNFIKKKYNNCIQTKNISDLISKTMCIDTPCLIYKLKFSNPSENSKNWINNFLNFILKLLNNNTNMWFIMEGKAPIEKKNTQEQRSIAKTKLINRTIYLKTLLNNYYFNNIITEELNAEWNKLKPKDSIESFNPDFFEKKIIKRELYSGYVSKEDYNLIQEILDVFEIPYIYSETEAETLCAYLNKTIDFIYSHDSDVLAYNTSKGLINNINFSDNNFTFIDKKELLTLMNFTNEQFIDFCILCGTDYNITIKKIGIINSFKLISLNKKLENLNLSDEDLKNLNVEWIRHKFNLCEFNNTQIIYYPFKIHYLNLNLLNVILDKNNIVLYNYVQENIKSYLEIQTAQDLLHI